MHFWTHPRFAKKKFQSVYYKAIHLNYIVQIKHALVILDLGYCMNKFRYKQIIKKRAFVKSS